MAYLYNKSNEKASGNTAFIKRAGQEENRMEAYDVIVIGAGVVGSAVARELTRYRLDICVLEKDRMLIISSLKIQYLSTPKLVMRYWNMVEISMLSCVSQSFGISKVRIW